MWDSCTRNIWGERGTRGHGKKKRMSTCAHPYLAPIREELRVRACSVAACKEVATSLVGAWEVR